MRLLFSILFTTFFHLLDGQGTIMEYGTNHLNELYPKKILICKDQVIELTAPDDHNPENCYHWSPVSDPYKYLRSITIEPQITTDYSVQITNYTTGESYIYFITVYVIDHIDLYETNNIEECMERRQLILNGELIGTRMNEVNYSQDNQAFIFFRRRINNNYYPDHKWFPVVAGKFKNAFLAPTPAGPFQLMDYYAVLKGTGTECISNPVSIKIHRLWIEKFKDPASPQNHFVVVDRNIHHEALASADCANFSWELRGSTKVWTLNQNESRQSETMIIDKLSVINKNTQDFRFSYGVIKVSCKDETNQEYISFSDKLELPDNGNSTTTNAIVRIMPQTFRASVFYKKDEAHPRYNFFVPHWFIYWRQGVGFTPPLINDVKFIDINLPEFEYFKINKVFGLYQKPIEPRSFDANTVLITQLASEEFSFPPVSELHGHKINGIHNYFSTYSHELEHAKIFLENWPNGYNAIEDTDKDYYNDNWEIAHSSNKFEVRKNVIKDTVDIYDPENKNSVGFLYEEFRCLNTEEELVRRDLIKKHDHADWSFDPNFIFNGKQWK